MCEVSESCLQQIFEYLELTRAFSDEYLCDFGIIWRLIVLGVQRPRAGARVFRGGGKRGWGAMLGGLVCDVVVTPCDLCRLEMAQSLTDTLLWLCLGSALEL
jgi:hypothetical protein